MKKYINLIFTLIIISVFHCSLFRAANILYDEASSTEIYFINNSSLHDITVSVYPVSAVFTSKNSNPIKFKYTMLAATPIIYQNGLHTIEYRFDYINLMRCEKDLVNPPYPVIKTNSLIVPYPLTNGGSGYSFDPSNSGNTNGNFGVYGVGIYKIVFTWDGGSDYCYYEQDAWNYPNQLNFKDLIFGFDNYNETVRIKYVFDDIVPSGYCNPIGLDPIIPISDVNRYIKTWKPYPASFCNWSREKNYGGFDFRSDESNYSKFPLDARQDCNLTIIPSQYRDQNQTDGEDNTYGKITLNLTLQKDLVTPVSGNRNDIIILNDADGGNGPYLRIADNKIFTLRTFTGHDYGTNLTVTPHAILWLVDNSQVYVESFCALDLKNQSNLILRPNSSITMESGSRYCNEGATIYGPGHIYIQGHTSRCILPAPSTSILKDSVKMIIDTNAVFELADSTTYEFQGKETALICMTGSTIKFGTGSKLIFNTGARLKADHVKFMANDSVISWDGIYLNDLAQDTITNCTIENAVNGINIINRSSASYSPPPYATVITNCTFTNTTASTQLSNAIYVTNSDSILIKNDSIISNTAQGYISGITLDYCGGSTIDVTDNVLSNVSSGITVIHTSPYIERNKITGSSSVGQGISLDNSNGTIKYNSTTNFMYSLTATYSSPYLLKNTFTNAYNKGINIKNSSVPVMRYIMSGSTTRWLGGNNTITGTPSVTAIYFSSDAYPLIDSGYNNINSGSADYMNGTIPTALASYLAARMNYWTDSHPNSGKFNTSSGSVNFYPYYNGSSLPSTNGYETNSIGFGLYDTVYTQSGDNPLADILFIEAYIAENQANYTTAISKYKDMIADYSTSPYASISLSKIFNCMEKNRSSQSDYQQIETYYNSVRNNTTYDAELRETAEDLAIKSKFRQGLIDDAISDYNTMYSQNMNTSKGIHALINKECLEAMTSGDNQTSGYNTSKISRHLHNLYALEYGDGIFKSTPSQNNIPLSYTLYQNYPNPFNPSTTIKYDIPRAGMVALKIYDILGREIYSVNEFRAAGHYEVKFDASNYASGLYFYRIESGNFVQTKKMVLVK